MRNVGMKVKEIAAKVGLDHQVVRQRLALLKLPAHLQRRVHEGDLGVVKALRLLKGKSDPQDPKAAANANQAGRRRAPSLKAFQQRYETDPNLHEEVRKFLARDVLGIEYQPFAALQRAKEAGQEKEKSGGS
jgi:hypothetical protein